MESTLERIKQYIDYKKISVSAFEKQVNFSNGSFSSQLKKGKSIGVDKLENILTVFPDLSAEWLLTGNGDMVRFSDNKVKLSPVGINETKKLFLKNVYDSENWKLAQLLKAEVHKLIKSSLTAEIDTLKAYRDLTAKILKFINTIDIILDEHIELNIFDDLNSGKRKGDILNAINSGINTIKEIDPFLEKLNIHLQESINDFKPMDKGKELNSNGEDVLNSHLLEQEYEVVSRLKDKVKVYRRYTL